MTDPNQNMSQNLYQKCAVVTGAAGAIGAAVARRLAADGARVWMVDRDRDTLAFMAPKIANAQTAEVDLAAEAQIRAFYQRLKREGIGLDILVNAAGIPGEASLEAMNTQMWQQVLAVNTTAPMQMTRYALPLFNDAASIVYISSIAGLQGFAQRSAYCTSKAALMGLTRALAVELAPRSIRVNCLAPGTIDTPWIQRLIDQSPKPSMARQELTRRAPLGRMGTVEEIAALVAYLASEESRFMTGAVIPIDGGASVLG